MPDYSTTSNEQLASEIGNTYVSNNDRFVVSLIIGYDDKDPDCGVTSAEDAAAAALELTRDQGSAGTHWYVFDRATGTTQLIQQSDFEPDGF